MRTCVWCDGPLPEPQEKGHRRREFCSDSCKQKHYLWHRRMKQDADRVAETYWKAAYKALVEQYKALEVIVQERLSDLEEERKRADELEKEVQYYLQQYEAIQIDCVARLRAVGMNDKEIKEFEAYWEEHTKNPLFR